MKYAILGVLVVLALGAKAGNIEYGPPSHHDSYVSVAPQAPVGNFGVIRNGIGLDQYTPKVFKHVYVHTAPDDPTEVQNRVIRVPGGDKHVNIIFVKAPSQSHQSQTEVILPEQDQQKNIVYVLVKKGENKNDVKIRKPAPQPQQKPEVYFIRYKDQQQIAGSGGGFPAGPVLGPVSGGPPAPQPVIRTPAPEYGTPF